MQLMLTSPLGYQKPISYSILESSLVSPWPLVHLPRSQSVSGRRLLLPNLSTSVPPPSLLTAPPRRFPLFSLFFSGFFPSFSRVMLRACVHMRMSVYTVECVYCAFVCVFRVCISVCTGVDRCVSLERVCALGD